LVNAIAREVIVKLLDSDHSKPITAELVGEAIQNIILNRPTHIDSLLERLKEKRVQKVLEPMILGENFTDKGSEDFLYTKDLGLIRVVNSLIEPANPIYAEIIIRKLSSDAQEELSNPIYPYQVPRYLKGGRIDMDYLMRDFQQFWQANGDIWTKKVDYQEAAPHLVLMAFLQRIINGGGQVIREMASGTGRFDLCLIYNNQKYPIELKLDHSKKYIEEGLIQTARYMDIHCCNEGWLVVFSRDTNASWENKLYMKKENVDGKTITIVGV
jgi:Holliday junction resolvase